jgi:hypothetical protein
MTVKFRYIGEYPDGMESVRCFDVAFTPGVEVEVPDRCVEKARGNRFFEEVEAVIAPPAKTEEQPLQSKEDLIALAEAQGVAVDKRWNAAKMAAAIEASTE